MSHDLPTWIATRRSHVLSKLDGMQASTRPTISEPLRDILAKRMFRGFVALCLVVGANLMVIAFNMPSGHHVAGEAARVMAVLAPGAIILFLPLFMVLSGCIPQAVAAAVWAIPLSAHEATKIKEWATLYPPVRQACVKWAASRPDESLNSVDFARLRRVCAKAEALDNKLREYQATKLSTETIFNDMGLLEEIRSTRAHARLEHSTHPAHGTSSPRRI